MCRGLPSVVAANQPILPKRDVVGDLAHLTSPVMAGSTVRALPRDPARTSDSAAVGAILGPPRVGSSGLRLAEMPW
jgi:hypothetical protein